MLDYWYGTPFHVELLVRPLQHRVLRPRLVLSPYTYIGYGLIKTVQFWTVRFRETSLLILSLLISLDYFITDYFIVLFSKVRKNKISILIKNNDCLYSDIQNLCNALSDWLIQRFNNPVKTNETIPCACCHIVCDNSGTSYATPLDHHQEPMQSNSTSCLSFSFYTYCYTLSRGLWAGVYCTQRFCRIKAYK